MSRISLIVKADAKGVILHYKNMIRRFRPLNEEFLLEVMEQAKLAAQNRIKQIIPADRRTGVLENSFIIDPMGGGAEIEMRLRNFAPYAPFIDQNDIHFSTYGKRKLSRSEIEGDPGLKRWFIDRSDFYKIEGRLPKGANIGIAGGEYHNYSIFRDHPEGIQFMRSAYRSALMKINKEAASLLGKLIR